MLSDAKAHFKKTALSWQDYFTKNGEKSSILVTNYFLITELDSTHQSIFDTEV